jgi:hypothetical protein
VGKTLKRWFVADLGYYNLEVSFNTLHFNN